MSWEIELEGIQHLTPEQWEELQSIVTHPGAQVPLSIVGCTGLQKSEFLHLNSDWIDWHSDRPEDPDVPIIHIPNSEECRRRKIPRGSGTEMTVVDRDGPCPNCKENTTDGYYHTDRHETATKNIPVPDPKAIQVLEWWFKKYDTIPWNGSYRTLGNEVGRILGRKISHTGLRRTFAARAAKNGLQPDEIASFLGISPTAMENTRLPYKQIVIEYGDYQYFGDKKQLTFQDYLNVLHKIGPASSKEISYALDRTVGAVNGKLSWMEKEHLVRDINNAPVGSKQMWKPTAPVDTLLECREGCNESFSTVQGRSLHETKAH